MYHCPLTITCIFITAHVEISNYCCSLRSSFILFCCYVQMEGDKFEIVFVNDHATPLLSAAFDAVSSYENLTTKRLDEVEIMNRYPKQLPKRTSFVFCRFEGECFEHLRSMGAAIYGPQIILHYVRENKPLPKVSYPLFSTALMGAIATVTSVTGSEREYLLSSIQMLHGQASRDLFDGVNVVITPKVGSKKYLVGASRGLHILLPSWISEAWRLSSIQDPIDMMLPAYTERYRVPVFSQLVICVSGLSAEERKEVSDLVLKHGGRYSGVMKVGETTHLIIKQPVGLKYSHAKKWKIQTVSLRWLVDSVNKGYALDEEDYRVSESCETSSTPVGDANKRSFSFDNISVISHVNNASTRIDETRSDCQHAESFIRPKLVPRVPLILSNCVFTLFGCTREESASFSKLVGELGGHLCTELPDQVSEAVTHVLVGSATNATALLQTREKDMLYVKGSWLVACKESGQRLSETNYLVPLTEDAEDRTTVVSADEEPKRIVDTEDLQLINQYFGSGGLADMDDFTSGSQNLKPTVSNDKTLPDATNIDITVANGSTTVSGDGFFSGLSFLLHDELSAKIREELKKSIFSSGGRVVDSPHNVDFLVAPFFVSSFPKLPKSCVLVTAPWIEHCIAESGLQVDELLKEPAFVPIERTGAPPLKDCVISMSGFVGRDRSLLTAYAQCLGALVQDCFLRKPVPSRNLAASTHLVSAKPDGRKWPAAQSWGIPTVSRSWLYACAERWMKVKELDFPVQNPSGDIPTQVSTSNPTNGQSGNLLQTERVLKEIQANTKQMQPSEPHDKPHVSTPVPGHKVSGSDSLLGTLRTPDWVCNSLQTDIGNSSKDSLDNFPRPSPPLSEQVAKCLKNAVARTAALPKRKLDLSYEEPDAAPLRGVVICVAKHLSSRQVELNGITRQLGGDFKWIYDPLVCTHIIAEYETVGQVPPSDNQSSGQQDPYPDVTAARSAGKFIVNPRWLTSCEASSSRQPERDFPPTESSRPVLETPDEPPRKVIRTASSNLLGDVSRRLELVLGVTSKVDQHEEAPLFGVGGSEVRGKRSPTSDDVTHGEIEGAVSFLADTAGSGPRRLRRNPRRATHLAVVEQGSGTNIPPEVSGPSSPAALPNPTDKAQPGQSLMVRWKYEDAPPRSPELSNQSAPSLEQHRAPHSPMPSNPGQGIMGIEPIATRERGMKRPASSISLITEDKLTSVPPQTATKDVPASREPEPPRRYVISFSGLPNDARDHYAHVVSQLGGEVDSQLTISEHTTHLIVHTPTRSEKYLICLATGKWILHKSYLDACLRESRWVDECNFEWGGPGTEPLLMQLSPAVPAVGPNANNSKIHEQRQQANQMRELARAARHWRLAGGKAFKNWRVIFGPGCDKETSFRRVIEAGAGQVLASGPPYPPASSVTHSFYKSRSSTSVNRNELPAEYEWLRIDYLLAYLTAGTEVSREGFALGTP
ncbi:BRCA1 protein [Opisthorchis viverrini]|uniref:BRCA1 protein n=1 Tax=Opisthorchis viverrini TaxID=6198 RepID=A0A1S8WJD0_OPIVI|nr:BRCA1 protein [Opisthorchis viverrini]